MKKLITTFLGMLFLTSCNITVNNEGKTTYENIVSKFQTQEAVKQFQEIQKSVEKQKIETQETLRDKNKTVSLIFEKNGDIVEMYLQNPKKEFIQSVRTWLAFPQGSLVIQKLNLNTSVFDLAAPNEYIVDTEQGLIQIGLSSTQGTSQSKVFIGSFQAIPQINDMVPLSCYDYSDKTDSHCTVLGEEKINLLKPVTEILI